MSTEENFDSWVILPDASSRDKQKAKAWEEMRAAWKDLCENPDMKDYQEVLVREFRAVNPDESKISLARIYQACNYIKSFMVRIQETSGNAFEKLVEISGNTTNVVLGHGETTMCHVERWFRWVNYNLGIR